MKNARYFRSKLKRDTNATTTSFAIRSIPNIVFVRPVKLWPSVAYALRANRSKCANVADFVECLLRRGLYLFKPRRSCPTTSTATLLKKRCSSACTTRSLVPLSLNCSRGSRVALSIHALSTRMIWYNQKWFVSNKYFWWNHKTITIEKEPRWNDMFNKSHMFAIVKVSSRVCNFSQFAPRLNVESLI